MDDPLIIFINILMLHVDQAVHDPLLNFNHPPRSETLIKSSILRAE